MSLDLQQTVSLVIYTNAMLHGEEFEYSSELWTIKFAEHVPKPESVPVDVVYDDKRMIASNPSKWLDFLEKRGVTKLRLHYLSSSHELPDRITAAFVGGGGRWIIEAIHGSTSDIYERGNNTSGGSSKIHGAHYL